MDILVTTIVASLIVCTESCKIIPACLKIPALVHGGNLGKFKLNSHNLAGIFYTTLFIEPACKAAGSTRPLPSSSPTNGRISRQCTNFAPGCNQTSSF